MKCEFQGCQLSARQYLSVAHAGTALTDDSICLSQVDAYCNTHLHLMKKRYNREFAQAWKQMPGDPHCAHCRQPISKEEMIRVVGVLRIP